MRSVPTEVKAELRRLLPSANFADAFSLIVDEPALDAVTAAHRAIETPPRWALGLMWLRDILVRPLRLLTRSDVSRGQGRRIGMFPVLSETSERVVMGLNDRHLDFRLSVDVTTLDQRRREVTATTLVETHGLLGRTYLALVLPFHRIIVPSMLAQVERPN